ncbi:glutamate racemase [Alcaligenaceae bacterium SJ-26]|nr:glutamate racemase [Alcaligenaceae bacterium SJ-26]
MSIHAPIGVYDSGLGGLSILQDLQRELPHEHFLYVADSAHLPYGERSSDYVRERALTIARFFVDRGVKAMVIACNTATTAAATLMREHFPDLILIGVEPAIKPALALTRAGSVGVLATAGTLRSASFRRLCESLAEGRRIVTVACPSWVELVEQGEAHPDMLGRVDMLIAEPVRKLLEQGADVLVLGCTHFPFLRDRIAPHVPEGISVLDTGAAVARQTRRRLAAAGLLTPEDGTVPESSLSVLSSSGETEAISLRVSHLLRQPVRVAQLAAAYC